MWQKANDNRVCSGLLIKDLPVLISIQPQKDQFAIYPYNIVLTQACDIESYYKSKAKWDEENEIKDRQLITQIIFCPAFDEEKFKKGNHLEDQYKYCMPNLSNRELEKIKKLENLRYHFFESKEESIPNLFLDFKQYFTLPINLVLDILENVKDLSFKLDHLQYIKLADRFAFFIQRVAIP